VPPQPPPERRGRLRVGAVRRSHSCWHFVLYAVVVFASASCWGSPPRKGRLGGLKESRGGRRAANIAFIHPYLRNSYLFLPWFCFLLFSLFPPQLPKTMGKIFARTRKFCPAAFKSLSQSIQNMVGMKK